MIALSRHIYNLPVCLAILLTSLSGAQMTDHHSAANIDSAEGDSAAVDTLIHVVFPADSSTFATDSIRFGAWTPNSGATVHVQDSLRQVYPSGAIVGMIHLVPGENIVSFEAVSDSSSFATTLHLFRKEPIVTLPEHPARLAKRSIMPTADQTYYVAQTITVRAQGSPGGQAMFKIAHLTGGKLPMTELPPSETGGVRGIYEGAYQIRSGDACKLERVKVWLKGARRGLGSRASGRSAGRITVDLRPQPVVLATRGASTLIYNMPGGEIVMDLPADILFKATAQLASWWQIELSNRQRAYTAVSGVSRIATGRAVPDAFLRTIAARVDSAWLTITMALSGRVPYRIAQGSSPQRLSLYFHRTSIAGEWTRYPESSSLVEHYDWEQVSESLLRFDIYLRGEQQWGYKATYTDDGFELSLRLPPVISKKRPFGNLIIALDAGHGGDHKGSVGATGLMEKDVNLTYTLELARLLEEAGATVILTRDTDTTMNLAPRVQIAREAGAHILVWMHNNSTSLARDPLEIRGTSTFYTNLQGLPFSQALYPHMLALGLEPQGIVHRSYYVTRQTDPVIYLVEGAFLSHPLDEIYLLDEENLHAMAKAVFQGLKDRLMALTD